MLEILRQLIVDFWATVAEMSPYLLFGFFVAGPATNAAGLATIWTKLGRRTAILYLLTVAGCALASGLLLDALISSADVNAACHNHSMGPGLLGHISAVILLAVLGYALLRPKRH
jgi:hypothetical protein